MFGALLRQKRGAEWKEALVERPAGAMRSARCQGCELSGQSDSGLLLAECTGCAVLHCFEWFLKKELQLCPSSG